ncbi:SDR family NAD(P)-dependent oxidoreductase [Halomonas halocynthiae]|uniref:SDR family NAD(P)-dependent oxidoreductase n=1 Tax=Halomonas halocynthiae TaxID=176290 RepID=UPI0003FA0602|nr:SDR family NAD(P)-dependent oxidoreductase [Halomonas halocynthiae]
MPTQHRLILITGASGAIGQALALEYARAGHHLLLQGRRADVLNALAEQCRQYGARAEPQIVDLTDIEARRHWLEQLRGDALPDLVIANAGINISNNGEGESPAHSQRLLEVNLQAPMMLASQLAPAMRTRGSGQLVFISSLAAWYGLPVTPSYCASKAGIKAYGEALRGWLAPYGVGVSVVMPGYVSSPMADAMLGPKPWEWHPERAARAIRRGVERNRARISFPFPLNIGSWCLAVLPAAISQRLVIWLGYGSQLSDSKHRGNQP